MSDVSESSDHSILDTFGASGEGNYATDHLGKKPDTQTKKKQLVKETKELKAKKATKPRQTAKGFNKQQEETFEMYSKNYKKVPCEFYKKGHCKNGDDCTYRHDIELKRLDTICKFFLTDSCHNPKCLYLHDKSQYPCKFLNISGKCDKMAECIFSHERFKNKEQVKDFVLSNLESLRNHRDIGMMTPLVRYAIEMKYIKESRAEENTTLSLVPTELYGDDHDDPLRTGGQIRGDFAAGVDRGFAVPNPEDQPFPLADHWGPEIVAEIESASQKPIPSEVVPPAPPKINVRAVFKHRGKCNEAAKKQEVLFMP